MTLLSPGAELKIVDGVLIAVRRGRGRPKKTKEAGRTNRYRYPPEFLTRLCADVDALKASAARKGGKHLTDSGALRLLLSDWYGKKRGYTRNTIKAKVNECLPAERSALWRYRRRQKNKKRE